MRGKVCVVTGANSGIGRSMATELARRGARVVMVCRNPDKAEAARADVKRDSGSDEVELELADLSSLDEVRALAERLNQLDRLDVLLNNAGVYLPNRLISPDGHEMMLAVNHLAPFLLTLLTRGKLAEGGARVVTTSSIGHKLCRFDLDDLQAERRFTPVEQYGVTKLANILFTKELARRFAADGVTANCFHPGAVATGFAQDEPGLLGGLMKVGKMFLRSPDKGARTGVYLAADEGVADVSGAYFVDDQPRQPSKAARDEALARGLWERSLELVER